MDIFVGSYWKDAIGKTWRVEHFIGGKVILHDIDGFIAKFTPDELRKHMVNLTIRNKYMRG